VTYNFLPVERDQSFLLPPSMTDWLPEDHLAFFVLDVVENMDLRPFYLGYRQDGWGGAAHEPRMMVALLLYAYCVGERSSGRSNAAARRTSPSASSARTTHRTTRRSPGSEGRTSGPS